MQARRHTIIKETLENFITAGEGAKLLTFKYGVKIYARDLEPFASEWRTVGVFKGLDGMYRGRRVWVFAQDVLDSLSLEQILSERKFLEKANIEDQKVVQGWYISFKKESIDGGKKAWKPYLGVYSGPVSDIPKNFVALTKKEFECAKFQAGRKMNAYENPDFTEKKLNTLQISNAQRETEKEADFNKRQDDKIVQLGLLKQEKILKESLLADYVIKAKRGLDALNKLSFTERVSDSEKFESQSLKKLMQNLYNRNPSPLFLLWNYREVCKRIAEFFSTTKDDESNQALTIRALWHVFGIEKIVSEGVIQNLESRREESLPVQRIDQEIKLALTRFDPIHRFDIFQNKTDVQIIQEQVSIYYDSLAQAAIEGKGLKESEVIARGNCFSVFVGASPERLGEKRRGLKI